MTVREFIRAVYKAATPSVDLETYEGEPINPSNHTIKMSAYERILSEMPDNMRLGCNMWCLNQGPKLIEG
jgi:hypothetical protein